MVPLSSVLKNTGLVHGYLTYHSDRRDPVEFLRLWRKIRRWKPDVLIYLAEPRGPFSAWRDAFLFKLCGVKQLAGVPYTKDLRENQWLADERRHEHEARRLLRCLGGEDEVQLEDSKNWDLRLTAHEEAKAAKALANWEGRESFFVSSVAAKVREKDWSYGNWSRLFSRLSQIHSKLGLVLVGAESEKEYSQQAAKDWKVSFLNLCGRLSVRETAAVMKRALFYLGHDSGPMHLAAAAGIPCVAIFVECKRPGVWFPYGSGHRVIYRETNGRNPAPTPVTVDEVLKVTQEMAGEKLHAPA